MKVRFYRSYRNYWEFQIERLIVRRFSSFFWGPAVYFSRPVLNVGRFQFSWKPVENKATRRPEGV